MSGSGGSRRIGRDPASCSHERQHVGKYNGNVCADCATIVPKKKWAVWLPHEKRGYAPAHPELLWWSFVIGEAEAKASFTGGKAVDLEWLLLNQDGLRAGTVTA